MFISAQSNESSRWSGMNRMIRSDSSIFSLQMKCFYISEDYKPLMEHKGRNYIKDIFED